MRGRNPGVICFLLVLALISCNRKDPESVSITGNFSDVRRTELQLMEVFPDSLRYIMSFRTGKDGGFSINFKPDSMGIFIIRKGNTPLITLITGRGEQIELSESDTLNRMLYNIKGSVNSRVFQEYLWLEARNEFLLDSLGVLLKGYQSSPDFLFIKKELDSIFYTIAENHIAQTREFVKQNASSLASILVLNRNSGRLPSLSPFHEFSVFEHIDSSLKVKYAANPHYLAYHSKLEEIRKQKGSNENESGTAISTKLFSTITLPGPSGSEKLLSPADAKITLVYLWVSWSTTCRQMNLELNSIYEEYHPKGFEIYAISLDQEKSAWLEALRRDRMKWIQVNDPKGLNSGYASALGVKALPTTILIDKNANFLNSGLSPRELRLYLNKHLVEKE
ncbi:MAG: TlpA family protein disulfide reductase [Bacteroidales bacterium]|nr:TlpA family protein disulfide reductase [Bacteroidales bacterium]